MRRTRHGLAVSLALSVLFASGVAYGAWSFRAASQAPGTLYRADIEMRMDGEGRLVCGGMDPASVVAVDGAAARRLAGAAVVLPFAALFLAGGTRGAVSRAGLALAAAFWCGAGSSAWAYTTYYPNHWPWPTNPNNITSVFPVSWYIDPAGTPDIADEATQLQNALNQWSTVSGCGLQFLWGGNAAGAPDSSARNGVCEIGWIESSWTTKTGKPLTTPAFTRIWFYGAGMTINETDLYFNGEGFVWTSNMVLFAGLHELGHAAGLNHSAVTSAAMYASSTATTLATDDQDGVRYLYPASGDSTAPAQITTLAAATGTWDGEVNLTWTSTGDDGSTGTAASYTVKRSSAAITDANWAAATTVTSGVPTPLTNGTSQSMTVSGLTPGTTYFFAIQATDEAGNSSSTSNSPSASARTGAGADAVAPAVAVLSAATGSGSGEVDLTWTSPGDDNSTGTATTYDLRYSTVAITAGNWALATQVAGEPAPGVAGTAEAYVFTGTAGVTYYFALKTSDEIPNTAAVSNSPSAAASTGSSGVPLPSGGGGGGPPYSPRGEFLDAR